MFKRQNFFFRQSVLWLDFVFLYFRFYLFCMFSILFCLSCFLFAVTLLPFILSRMLKSCYQHLNMCEGRTQAVMPLQVLFQLLTVFADVTASRNKPQDICTSAVTHIFKLNCVSCHKWRSSETRRRSKFRPPGHQQLKRQVIPRVLVGRNVIWGVLGTFGCTNTCRTKDNVSELFHFNIHARDLI